MVTVAVFTVAGLVLLGLVVAAGTHMVRHPGEGASVMGDALGNFIDVFDPARAKADLDLESKKHEGEAVPSPGDDDRPVVVDLTKGVARVRRTA